MKIYLSCGEQGSFTSRTINPPIDCYKKGFLRTHHSARERKQWTTMVDPLRPSTLFDRHKEHDQRDWWQCYLKDSDSNIHNELKKLNARFAVEKKKSSAQIFRRGNLQISKFRFDNSLVEHPLIFSMWILVCANFFAQKENAMSNLTKNVKRFVRVDTN